MSTQPGDVLSSFESLSTKDQQAFLSLLPNSVNVTALRTLQNSIDATQNLTRDFVEEFPLELVMRIFSFLPPATAFLLQRVSKAWQAKLLAEPMLQQMKQLWIGSSLAFEGDCDPCNLPVIRARVETMHRFREGKPLASFTVPAPFQNMTCSTVGGFRTSDILSIGPDHHGNFWIFNLISGHASQHKLSGVRWTQWYQDGHSILFSRARSMTDERGFVVLKDDVAAQLMHIDTRSRAESTLLLPASKINTGARFVFTADRSIVAYYEDADGDPGLGELGLWRPANRRLIKIQVGHVASTYLAAFTKSSVKVILLEMDLDEASQTITLIMAADPREENIMLSAKIAEESRDSIMFSVRITYDPDIFLSQRHQKLTKGKITVSALRDATGTVLPAEVFGTIAEIQGFIGTKHANSEFFLCTSKAVIKVDLSSNTYRLSWRSSSSGYMNAAVKWQGVMYAIDTVPWPADENGKITFMYRLHHSGFIDRFRSETGWKNCQNGLDLGPTSVFGSRSINVMLRPASLTLWCFDPEFEIKASWFDFSRIQVGKIWPGPRALGADD